MSSAGAMPDHGPDHGPDPGPDHGPDPRPDPAPAQGPAAPRPSRALLLVVFAAIVALAGTFSVPPLDRDEARFAQATTQMLETGDYINIRFQEQERNKKPAGIYWLQAASVKLLSSPEAREIWAYRVPSFLAALLAAFLAYRIGCRFFDEDTAFLGTLLLIAVPSFSGEATIAKTDAALLATVLAAQLALSTYYRRGLIAGERVGLATVLLFWIALAIGILIKGPITPMISFLTFTILVATRLPRSRSEMGAMFDWFMSFRPVTGLVVLSVLVGPWLLAINLETQGRFFLEALGGDMLGKVGEAHESHSGPFGYYLIVVWIMFWPAALLLPATLREVLRQRHHQGVIFCLAWLVPSWLVFELASTKLPHYTLPLYPALALLVAFTVTSLTRAPERGMIVSRAIGSALYLLVAGLVAALVILAAEQFRAAGAAALDFILAGIILAGALISTIFLWQRRWRRTLISTALTGGILAWVLYEAFLPRLDRLQLSPRLSASLTANALHPIHNGAEDIALLGYNEPSAIFLIGTGTRISTPESAAAWLREQPGRVAAVESRYREAFLRETRGTQLREIAVLDGYNYSNAIDVVVTLYISE